jgi:DNA-binding MarR family transcriptional regulator
MDTSTPNIQILKLFSEIIAQTINEIDSFQITHLDKDNNETQLNIGKDILIIHDIGSKIDCSMKDIIIATGLPNSTATRRVGYLIEKDLLLRKISKKDKRKTILKLTKNGRKAFSLFFDYFTQKFEKILKMINEEEKEVLIKIFKSLMNSS